MDKICAFGSIFDITESLRKKYLYCYYRVTIECWPPYMSKMPLSFHT